MKKYGIIPLALIVSILSFSACEKDSDETTDNTSEFTLSSPEIESDQLLPEKYTCDGESYTLPLEWNGIPEGTESLALIMHHEVSESDIHWYWVIYDISPELNSIVMNASNVGTLGNNSVNGLTEYAPPCSKGPGQKEYIYTLYALSTPVELDVEPKTVSREILLDAMEGKVIESCELRVFYSRSDISDSPK